MKGVDEKLIEKLEKLYEERSKEECILSKLLKGNGGKIKIEGIVLKTLSEYTRWKI